MIKLIMNGIINHQTKLRNKNISKLKINEHN